MLDNDIILRLEKFYRSQASDWSDLNFNYMIGHIWKEIFNFFSNPTNHMLEVQNLTNQVLENDFMLRFKKFYKHRPWSDDG